MGKAPSKLSRATVNHVRAILSSLDQKFPIAASKNLASLVNFSSHIDEPIHRWFRYREGFSTKLVEASLAELRTDQLVVDPFCGCGTTLLTARNNGYHSLGVDANPLSAFVTRVKTRNYSTRQLRRFQSICKEIEKLTRDEPAYEQPKLSIISKVFLPEVLHSLLVIKFFIENHLARIERDFFFLAWLSILEEVSNVFKEGNGIKYRNRKRTPTGYIHIPIDVWQQSLFPEDKFDHVINKFISRAKTMIEDARAVTREGVEPDVFDGDALSLDEFVKPDSAGLVIFSPPYANNFNYFKAYKIELWMGGFVTEYDDLLDITRRSLRSHVETRLDRESDLYNWYPEALDQLLELINPETLWTSRIPNAIRGYFYDMRKVLHNVFRALDENGKCVIVVGNSAYGSILIPTDALLAEIASVEGFEVQKIAIARHLTTSSQQKMALEPLRDGLRESILYLKKPGKRTYEKVVGNGRLVYESITEIPKFPRECPPNLYVIKNQRLTDETHVFHKFPGKFIPHIPRWAIKRYVPSKKRVAILDPFAGSGTSLVEAHLSGHSAFGIDIDPLARLICKVKTTPVNSKVIQEAVKNVTAYIERTEEPAFRPEVKNLEHWFTPTATKNLGVIRDAIEPWRTLNKDVYDFLIITFSSIIRRVSNADNQSLKTYVSGTHPKTPAPVKPTFLKALTTYADRLIQFSETVDRLGRTTILESFDARVFAESWKERGLPDVDLAITSPPYIKSIDYIYNQMAEYFWVGDLFDLAEKDAQNKAKQRYIGTEKVGAKATKRMKKSSSPIINSFADRIWAKNRKHGYIFEKFFTDLGDHFGEMYKVMKPNGLYVMVVGDSSISDIPIPTHELLAQVAAEKEFQLVNQFAYEIRNRYMRFPRQGRGGMVGLDWVMTFHKVVR